MRLKRSLLTRTAAICFAAALSSVTATAAFAEQVKLVTTDGRLTVEGDLQSFENGIYIIETALGVMKISANLVACEGDGCPAVDGSGEDILIVGSDTLGVGLMPLLLEGFASERGGIVESQQKEGEYVASTLVGDGGFGDPIGNFKVSSTSSSDAFSGLLDESVKVGMSSRRILPAEARQLRNAGAGNLIDINQERVVAVDSISVIVHPDNPIQAISLDNLDRIYSGQITNWSEVGGPDAPIKVFGRESGSGTASVFENRVFAQSGRSVSSEVEVKNSSEEMATAVRSDINSIGFVASAFERGTKPLDLIESCGLTSSPTAFGAKTEEYPLQRRLYLYNRADNLDPTTQQFLDFAVSEQADGVIAKSGLIDLSVSSVSQDLATSRIKTILENAIDPFEFKLARDLLLETFDWDRLSTTFRFASGSSQLDVKGQADLQRLISFLKTQPAGTELAVVGFTDGDGAFEPNRALSFGRAERVAEEIIAAGGPDLANVRVTVKGYGELAPTACNDTLEGKRINRRVEVWLRQPA